MGYAIATTVVILHSSLRGFEMNPDSFMPCQETDGEQQGVRITNSQNPMCDVTEEQVQIALSGLQPSLTKYLWLQRQVRLCDDISTNGEFQRRFIGFYRVRRNSGWCSEFFKLMGASKSKGIDFPEALREINCRCGKIEASFASKLVATLDPSKPVIDKFVLSHFAMRLPRWGSTSREEKTIKLYCELCGKYADLLQSPTGKLILGLFDLRYPNSEVTELKKVDLVLWQVRA